MAPGFLLLAIIGVAAGYVASKVMKTNLSVWETVAVGVLGAIIGGVILRFAIALSGAAFGFLGAVAGACLLIWLYHRIFGARR